ncbi:MAG: hypothetical protein DYH13_10775 [Alphaproteobacteria bacterium PRO2]|nr:hypothetical protein [Alphaproteobacteria bacterium PRO2]
MQDGSINETVGVFNDMRSLNEAIAELEGTAFPRQDISILDERAARSEGIVMDGQAMADDPEAPRTILIRPEEKAIGVGVIIGGGFYAGVVTGMFAAGIGAPMDTLLLMGLSGGLFGASLGALVAWLLGYYYNGLLLRQIKAGRMILWVRTPGEEEQMIATDIMRRHGGRRVHVHQVH